VCACARSCVRHGHLFDVCTPPGSRTFGWHFVYLTTWNGYIQVLYFTMAAVDLIKYFRTHTPHTKQCISQHCYWLYSRLHIHTMRFFTVSVSFGIFTCLGYYTVDAPLKGFPTTSYKWLIDLGKHAFVPLFPWVDMFLVPHRYAYGSRCKIFKELMIFESFILIWSLWTNILFAIDGFWTYVCVCVCLRMGLCDLVIFILYIGEI